MANEEHLKILQQGVVAWTTWRLENPYVIPDLSEAHLSGADLNWVDLSWAHLGWADLGGAHLTRANLSVADLSVADLSATKLVGAHLNGAHLYRANLYGTNLGGANLSGADLSEANLSETNLSNAKLDDASLHNTNFIRADLTGIKISGARIGSSSFSELDLSQVMGLESVMHQAPSSIGVDTLALTLRGSGGRFTQEQLMFFENAGVPATLLEYLPSILETNPLQFFSCFVSYSTRDEDFVEQLNQDLTDVGIKTWKWDRDAVRGRDLRENIDRAIRTHDKTILVRSVNSLTSPQVEREVQESLDKEARIKTANAQRRREALARGERPPTVDADVLVPIRLDETIFGWDSHLKGEVTRRMISDFTGAAPGGAKYNGELQKLVQALNPRSWPPPLTQSPVNNC